MNSWLDKMGAKAGILEEEEEEEEANEPIQIQNENDQNSSANSSPIKPLSNSNSETNILKEENNNAEEIQTENKTREKQEENEMSDYFDGKTTKTNLNFVRNIEKLQALQDKAYSSLLDKIGSCLITSNEFNERPLKISQTITKSSQDSKVKFQGLRTKVLSLSVPLF